MAATAAQTATDAPMPTASDTPTPPASDPATTTRQEQRVPLTTDDLAHATGADPDVVAALTEIFDDYRSRRGAPTAEVELDRTLWGQLDDLGLTRLTAPEADGGSGASWSEAAALLRLAAAAAAPLPLAEHDLLAGWCLRAAGLDADDRLRTVCRPDPGGHALNVTWARDAERIVALWEDGEQWRVADVPRDRVTIVPGRNVAGEPCDTVSFDVADLAAGPVVPDRVGRQFHLRGALARCVQVCGAMDRVRDIVLAHVTDRVQFGRPLSRFQAVQHLVADITSEAALASGATDAAVARAVASDWDDPGMLFAVGVAKSCTGHAASLVVRSAHQALGAIGTTLEHELGLLTRPILSRRSEYGSVYEWDQTLAALATTAGRDGLWPLMLTGSPRRSSSSQNGAAHE